MFYTGSGQAIVSDASVDPAVQRTREQLIRQLGEAMGVIGNPTSESLSSSSVSISSSTSLTSSTSTGKESGATNAESTSTPIKVSTTTETKSKVETPKQNVVETPAVSGPLNLNILSELSQGTLRELGLPGPDQQIIDSGITANLQAAQPAGEYMFLSKNQVLKMVLCNII